VGIVLSLIAGLLLHDSWGDRLGVPGAYVWATGLFLAFFLRLAGLAAYVLPPDAEETAHGRGWQEGLRAILYHFTVVARRQEEEGKLAALPPELPASFASFDAGIVDSHLALALRRGTTFSRAAGPGYVRLDPEETIDAVIDLRRQRRQVSADALSRDGIPLETTLSVTFRVRRPRLDASDGSAPYPYDRETVFRLLYADGVGSEREIPWHERITAQAASMLVAELARYRLDQLYQPAPGTKIGDAVSLSKIVEDVLRQLNAELVRLFDCSSLDECPVEILQISVDRLQPPPDVAEQRIQNWRSGWQRRLVGTEAATNGEELDEARLAALHEYLAYLTHPGETTRAEDLPLFSRLLARRTAALIAHLQADSALQEEASPEMLQAVAEASELLATLAEQEGGP
jgi:hypothetical protein